MIPFLAPLLLLALAPQEEPPIELAWKVEKDDRFDFKWSFNESFRHELAKVEGRSEADTAETYDRREVEAELYLKEDTPAGTILMALKKVTWSQGTHEYDCTLVWAEGRKVDVQTKIKVKDKASSLVKREEQAKQLSSLTADSMKKLVEGAYALSWAGARPGETVALRNNVAARTGNSIFDRLYLHSLVPRGSVHLNQAWKDPLEGAQLPQGLVEVDTISWKVTACGPKTGATVKGGFTFPINKTLENTSGGQVTDVRTTGRYALAREYSFAAEGHLASSKEEISFTKKTDAKGKDADFYKDHMTKTLKQALVIRKKKDPKKPEEKK